MTREVLYNHRFHVRLRDRFGNTNCPGYYRGLLIGLAIGVMMTILALLRLTRGTDCQASYAVSAWAYTSLVKILMAGNTACFRRPPPGNSMTRLTTDEIAVHKAWLANWRAPEEMTSYVEEVMDNMGSTDLFNQAGIGFLRDAWAAARFAELRNATALQLVSDEWPDFNVRFNARVEQFECVEADVLRRRGIEYRDAEGNPVREDPIEDWIKRAEQVPAVLEAAVEKKLGKNYASRVHLLIYLNVNECGIRQQDIESRFAEHVQTAVDHFATVSILWKGCVYGPWSKPFC